MSNQVLKGFDQNGVLRQVLLDEHGRVQTTFVDSPQVGSFGRIRTADIQTLFDTTFQYSTHVNHLMDQKLVGGGTVTHVPSQSSVQLTVTKANGDRAVFQSKDYIRYQPGKSQLIIQTGAFGPYNVGTIKRWGWGDDQNGFFWEQDGPNIYILFRTSSTGKTVDTRIKQSDWNLDPLDGTGLSGITIDPTKTQIVYIDAQWLGSGRIRFGFNIGGNIIYAHQFVNANFNTTAYMTTANLPIRWEIFNVAPCAATASMLAICGSISSEGRLETDRFFPFSVNNGASTIAVAARKPIISIRPKATLNGIVNRAFIKLQHISVAPSLNAILFELVYNATLNASSWTSADADSAVEFNTDATTISGGMTTFSFYTDVSKTPGTALQDLTQKLSFALDIDGLNPDIFTVVATPIGGAAAALASMNWIEIH